MGVSRWVLMGGRGGDSSDLPDVGVFEMFIQSKHIQTVV